MYLIKVVCCSSFQFSSTRFVILAFFSGRPSTNEVQHSASNLLLPQYEKLANTGVCQKMGGSRSSRACPSTYCACVVWLQPSALRKYNDRVYPSMQSYGELSCMQRSSHVFAGPTSCSVVQPLSTLGRLSRRIQVQCKLPGRPAYG